MLYRPLYITIKHKIGLSRTVHNNILEHPGIVNMKSLWKNQLAALITELYVLLNTTSKAQKLLVLRLKAAQLRLNITECILTIDPKFIVPYSIKNNLAFNILKKSKDYLYSTTIPQGILDEWTIQGKGCPIYKWLQSWNIQIAKKQTLAMMLSKQGIYYMPQLLNGTLDKPIEWCQLLIANNKKPKGPIPILYTLLKQHLEIYIIENRTHQMLIKDDKEIETLSPTLHDSYNCNDISNPFTPLPAHIYPSIKRSKLEWIIFQRPQDKLPMYGKINKKLINGNIHITH